MKLIPLRNRKKEIVAWAMVDDEDYDRCAQFSWYLMGNGYVGRNTRQSEYVNGEIKRIYLHRFIMNTPVGMDTDHIDMDKLNNQRSNLRACTRAQNMFNCGPMTSNKSGAKGVSWSTKDRRWVAQIKIDGKQTRIGSYKEKASAIAGYQRAAAKIHGEFLRL